MKICAFLLTATVITLLFTAGCRSAPGEIDQDGDGYPAIEDCNDADESINPGASENCEDFVDNDCDGYSDVYDDDCKSEPADDDGQDEIVVRVIDGASDEIPIYGATVILGDSIDQITETDSNGEVRFPYVSGPTSISVAWKFTDTLTQPYVREMVYIRTVRGVEAGDTVTVDYYDPATNFASSADSVGVLHGIDTSTSDSILCVASESTLGSWSTTIEDTASSLAIYSVRASTSASVALHAAQLDRTDYDRNGCDAVPQKAAVLDNADPGQDNDLELTIGFDGAAVFEMQGMNPAVTGTFHDFEIVLASGNSLWYTAPSAAWGSEGYERIRVPQALDAFGSAEARIRAVAIGDGFYQISSKTITDGHLEGTYPVVFEPVIDASFDMDMFRDGDGAGESIATGDTTSASALKARYKHVSYTEDFSRMWYIDWSISQLDSSGTLLFPLLPDDVIERPDDVLEWTTYAQVEVVSGDDEAIDDALINARPIDVDYASSLVEDVAYPEEEPTPTPVPTPVPDRTLEDGVYNLTAPHAFELDPETTTAIGGYRIVYYEADITVDSEAIVAGHNYFYFWINKSDWSAARSPDCVMPETIHASRNDDLLDSVSGSCPQCVSAYDVTFTPDRESTTCPQQTVEYWNGAANPWGDWYDHWGFSPTPDGYPTGTPGYSSSDIAALEAAGTTHVVYDNLGGPWEAWYNAAPE